MLLFDLFEAEWRCSDPEVQRLSCLLGQGPEDVRLHRGNRAPWKGQEEHQ